MATPNINTQMQIAQYAEDLDRLHHEVRYWKQMYLNSEPEMQRAIAEAEDLSDKLIEAQKKISDLTAKNEKMSERIKTLEEDKSVQEDLTSQAKMYASLIENMLDNEMASPSISEEKNQVEEVKENEIRLQQENQELHEMMDEFKNMWKKDSQDFQETISKVKEEGSMLQMEVMGLEQLRRRDQVAMTECFNLKLQEEEAHKETKEANKKLQSDVERLNADLKTAEIAVYDLTEKKQATDILLAQQEFWLKSQSDELVKALDDLFDSRNTTAEQLEDMKANWKLKEDAYEAKISSADDLMKEEREKFVSDHAAANNRIEQLSDDLAKLQNEYSNYRSEMEKQLQMAKSEGGMYYNYYIQAENEVADIQDSLKNCQASRDRDCGLLRESIDSVAAQLRESQVKLEGITRKYDETITKLQEADSDAKNCQAQLLSFKEDIAMLMNQKETATTENEQLRQRLNGTVRDYVAEKDRLEQSHDNMIAALQKKYSKQIEEVKHNNMLAINQEMIKAQMALDSEKKKNAAEKNSIRKELDTVIAEAKYSKKEAEDEIAYLNQMIAAVKNENATVRSKHNEVKKEYNSFALEMKEYIRGQEEKTAEQIEAKEQEIDELKKARQIILENMGVEELDEEPSDIQEEEEKNESTGWELVDEE